MSLHPSLASLALLALGASLSAQVTPHERTIPLAFTGSYTSGSNAFPLTRTRGIFQQWFRGTDLRVGPITAIGARERANITAPALSHQIEIVMSNTPATFSGLSKTFQQNLGPITTVFFKMKTINLPAIPTPQSNPDVSASWFLGDTPFIFVGPHLIVQWDIQTAATYGSIGGRYCDALYQTTTSPVHGGSGRSCGSAQLSSTYDTTTQVLTLSQQPVPANLVCLFVIGFDPLWLGPIRLPIDLSGAGFTGCTLDVSPILVVPAVATAAGIGTLNAPIPVPSADTWAIHSQGIFRDSGKPSGYATTNARWSLIGNTGQSNYLYNWTADGPTAQYGPYPVNSNVVLLLKP